jgi:phosphoribosylformimino-5-aminoimidazole carboxamide ribotide isomerase
LEIIPAIDLRDGRCVRLYQGDFQQETVFSEDPPQVARRWHALGASRLHVVDLDGAKAGHPVNSEAIRAIAEAVSIPIELGGGIRDIATIRVALSWGVERVVLGTVAAQNPALVAEACKAFGEGIVVGVDARGGKVAVQGWLETTSVDAADLVRRMTNQGVRRFIYTDIGQDGTEEGPNLQSLTAVLQATDRPVIASGGVGKIEHLLRLSEQGVEGVIVGRAIYTGAIDLAEALKAVAEHRVNSHANH